ncbi:hypothetical protein M1O57_03950 [Dehalococcoidia bacterium]|nr:hypothetical protein [Dehalococcoidia bacterium]
MPWLTYCLAMMISRKLESKSLGHLQGNLLVTQADVLIAGRIIQQS